MSISGFILAAGEGKRLRPATLTRPKALVPFCGVPLLELVASQLNSLDLAATVVNVHYQGERVRESVMRLAHRTGWDLRVSPEEALLGTGGGLRRGVSLLDKPEHILVHNVDTVLDYDLSQLVREHVDSGALATLLLVPERGPLTVDLAPDSRIGDFRRPHGLGAYTFTGVHIFQRDVLSFLPDTSASSIIEAYENALKDGQNIRGVVVGEDAYWADLGTAAQYIRAHGETADCALRFHSAMQEAQSEQARRRGALELKGVQCTGALGLGIGLGVPSGAHLHNVVLWDYTRLPRPLLYADGIFVGEDVAPAEPVDEERTPAPRVFVALDIDAKEVKLTSLKKQGSGRQYCRLSHHGKSWVWCAYDPERRENAGFAAISDFLHRLKIRVPEVLLHFPGICELVSRDLGQHVLVQGDAGDPEDYLCQVVEQIARLHVLGDQAARLKELPLQRGFTKGLYDWERDYFRENLLREVLGCPELWGIAAREYCILRDTLLGEPLVPIHRDLQSANVMIVDGMAYLIDFQGMRLGCAAYDLGALLYDPYQEAVITGDMRRRVWEHYCEQVRELGGTPPAEELLHKAAIQRLLQALGAYGKLWRKDEYPWYRQFIQPGLRLMRVAALEAQTFPALAEMAAEASRLATERPDP